MSYIRFIHTTLQFVLTYNFTTKGGTGLFYLLQLYHQRWNRLALSLTTLPPKVGQACSLHLQLYHQRWDRLVVCTYNFTTKGGTTLLQKVRSVCSEFPTALPGNVGQTLFIMPPAFLLTEKGLFVIPTIVPLEFGHDFSLWHQILWAL